MSQTIDKQKLELAMKWLNDIRGGGSTTSMLATAAIAEIDALDDQYPLGTNVEDVDYQQYYEQLVQAVYEFNGLSTSTAAALIAWMESVCPHFEDAHEAYKKRMKEESQ